jgi:hypothetical protein
MTLSQLRQNQPEWFSRKNKRFFGDVSYKLLHGKVSGEPFLVRATYAWTDMFDQPKRLHYRVNRIIGEAVEERKVGPLLDQVFGDLWEVKRYLAIH